MMNKILIKNMEFEQELYKIGSLCFRGHEWGSTGLSLRAKKGSSDCVECRKFRTKKSKSLALAEKRVLALERKQALESLEISLGIDRTRYYLGSIGVCGHEWMNSGYTLRRKGDAPRKGATCIVCACIQNSSPLLEADRLYWFVRSKDQLIQDTCREFPELNTDFVFLGNICRNGHVWNETGRSLRYTHRANSPCVSCSEDLNERNRDSKRERARERYWMPGGKESYYRSAYRRLALKNGGSSSGLNKSQRELLKMILKGACAYCRNIPLPEELELDHVIPLSQGGDDTPENLLPCCLSCNRSKKDKDFLSWYTIQPFYSKAGISEIFQILGIPVPEQFWVS
ncbi:HNH endonuclease (plasmid) [Kovacikia minuta CCNUW1]|uniref:HNH endonuclease n=1 Tax=Kovacikia minuta TaxID=2931930 RepID=UPI001CCE5D71|nr:HNH endonuclease signature motif containing protein [Kovacikia minuta]UBF29873.1 HNH endonuclease [Kovacikia minuta CCNUW1]